MNKCLNCGKDCHCRGCKYCSSDCQNQYHWKLRKQKIEETGYFVEDNNDQKARRIAKKYLLEKYGNKCSICGNTEWLGKPILLIVDHIDGDPTNSKIDNFRLICSNCDATLDTYKNKNKVKGKRKNRKLL